MLGVLFVVLAIGANEGSGPLTEEEQVLGVTTRIRCPTCRGLSAAVSDAPAAEAIRDEVRRRIGEGQSGDDVVAYLVGSYGQDILLEPDPSGPGLWVWLLPVVFALSAIGGMAIALVRRAARRPNAVSEEDRALVERERGRR